MKKVKIVSQDNCNADYYTVDDTNNYFINSNSYLRAQYLKKGFGFWGNEGGWAIVNRRNPEKVYLKGKLLLNTPIVIFEKKEIHRLAASSLLEAATEDISLLNDRRP